MCISSVGNITTSNGCLLSMYITSGKTVLHSCIVMSLSSHITSSIPSIGLSITLLVWHPAAAEWCNMWQDAWRPRSLAHPCSSFPVEWLVFMECYVRCHVIGSVTPKPSDSCASWVPASRKGKFKPEICINSHQNSSLPFPLWKISNIVNFLPAGWLPEGLTPSPGCGWGVNMRGLCCW